MTTATLPSQVQPSTLGKKILPGVTIGTLIVIIIMVASFGLHMININSIGNANEYYTAAVESMLKSWSNFFFIAAEPGGSVTVDKPPLGLWIEAIFAYFLGVSGFSVSLPNILAGVFGIGLLYSMVKKYMGELAGITAALVMAITPVFVATNRNNTMDGILVFTLLVAAWAFIKATESGKLRWVLLGAFIVGLGFNIKMLQAFLPLPAFYALYFFGSKEGWLKKIINLGIATVLLVAVSLSWAVVVDLVPAENRPFIGSSDDNTVMGLIFGHNGVSRLESNGGGGAPPSGTQPGQPSNAETQPQQNPGQGQQGQFQGPPPAALNACEGQTEGASCSFTTQNGNTINGSCIIPPNQTALACAPQDRIPQNGQVPNGQMPAGGPNGQNGGTPFSQETGSPGVLRFFTSPLSKQMSWLLPFALISVLLALFGSRIQLPIESGVHKALILWGGWLLTCVVFFSMVSGIFHAYYAIMLAPALGAMVGIGFAQLYSWGKNKNWTVIGLILTVLVTLGFQVFAASQYNEFSWWMIGTGILLGLGILLMAVSRRAAYAIILSAALIIPAYWSVMTVTSSSNNNLPTAYEGQAQTGQDGFLGSPAPGGNGGETANTELVDFLQANTQDVEYLVAVPSSQQGAELVLATGRPVLYMGGFGGQDEVVTADDLTTMVANGELRYVLYGGDRGNKQDITNWLSSSCAVVNDFSSVSSVQGQGGPRNQNMTLYSCR
ncbi:MAG: glycosyltransferase family 39 protein [Anaerolineales bacterium]|jgi:4-amino-4-deoxy-L-arabinose transferase-like glycosyltransferase|uniref:glycosyltransferase family 39 protein n=1 Tax=Candidatus Villigracilis vicinus TaxID=3140679 RepID=UPI003134D211|nr:glycosyltransferase family 39 protein [Anaerolineales bacterium]